MLPTQGQFTARSVSPTVARPLDASWSGGAQAPSSFFLSYFSFILISSFFLFILSSFPFFLLHRIFFIFIGHVSIYIFVNFSNVKVTVKLSLCHAMEAY
jgi:hypothetical protein